MIAKEAVEIARKYSEDPSVIINEKINVSGDVSKRIDIILEDLIVERIKDFDPGSIILSEEKGLIKLSNDPKHIYIIDPLDGSLNYATGTPYCSVSIGVAKYPPELHGDHLLTGVVAEIFRDKLYSFIEEREAYVNKKKVSRREYSENIIITYLEDPRAMKALYDIWITLNKPKIRSLGSAALDIVKTSLGDFKAFIDLRQRLRNVDIVASIGFARSLGVYPTDHKGEVVKLDLIRISNVKSLIVSRYEDLRQRIIEIVMKYID